MGHNLTTYSSPNFSDWEGTQTLVTKQCQFSFAVVNTLLRWFNFILDRPGLLRWLPYVAISGNFVDTFIAVRSCSRWWEVLAVCSEVLCLVSIWTLAAEIQLRPQPLARDFELWLRLSQLMVYFCMCAFLVATDYGNFTKLLLIMIFLHHLKILADTDNLSRPLVILYFRIPSTRSTFLLFLCFYFLTRSMLFSSFLVCFSCWLIFPRLVLTLF
jgi:hypothetical protein